MPFPFTGPAAFDDQQQVFMVEVLVEGQSDHSHPSAGLRLAREETGAHALGVESPFVFLADGSALRGSRLQIGRHFRLMSEQVAEHRIHVRQRQDGRQSIPIRRRVFKRWRGSG